MAQAGSTPIQLYYSTTSSAVPLNTNLLSGELAININDGKLFYKDSGGTVQVLATKGTGSIGGSNTQVQYNSSGALAGSANLTFNGTTLTSQFSGPLNGTVGATTPSTGAFTSVTSTSASGVLTRAAATQDGVALVGRAGGTSSYEVTLTPTTLSADRTLTLPDVSTTVVGTDATQTLSNKTLTGTTETVYAITDGAAFEINPANGGIQTITLGANRTPKGTSFAAGQSVTLMVTASTYTLTWTDTTFGPSGVKWVGSSAAGTAPTLSTSAISIIELWEVGSQVYGAFVGVA
jgi:hypothetical protein